MSAAEAQQRSEKKAGLLLLGSAFLALILANGPLAANYHQLLHLKIGPLDIHHWIADGLMAIFFLLVGLEVKREWLVGQLSAPDQRLLPMLAALAGMAIPALIYLLTVGGDPILRKGWAIPVATDIAFALGVLALIGSRLPASIKLLLVAIAIIDDIGAVLIIALVYTSDLNFAALGGALAIAIAMAALGRAGVRRIWPYMAGFSALWLLMHLSGVHATVAGVVAALTVPTGQPGGESPLRRLEHAIHPWVMFGVMPLFGLASAGVELSGGMKLLLQPLPLAILLGLFLGKQVGVFGALWLSVRTGIASKPAEISGRHLYGVALLSGIGFTMSLFIGGLAFPGDPNLVDLAKIGTLAGSLFSALAGFTLLRTAPPQFGKQADLDQSDDLFAAETP